MGLAIGYSVALSIPFIGGNLALLLGRPVPGLAAFESRMYIAHVLLLPVLIGALIARTCCSSPRATTRSSPEAAADEQASSACPLPGLRAALARPALGTRGVLFLLGGLVQINPIWLWGPYHVATATNGAQPDWYLGWLIGALRLVPSFDVDDRQLHARAEPVLGRRAVPVARRARDAVLAVARAPLHRDHGFHNVLDRPRDAPDRTAFGARFLHLGLPDLLRRRGRPRVPLPGLEL
jgi:ubiquinol-cytochrome c reductase cytochrome b subunit